MCTPTTAHTSREAQAAIAGSNEGRSDGGRYIGTIYTPQSVTVLFRCGTLTRFEIAMTS